ncbi:uncharacterized protein CBL_14529 [Carabus blaptoides fortunei]
MKTILGKTIYAFRGIPYAKPPVGELRFKPPEPVDKWNTTLDASKDGFACPQPSTYPVSDDCLVLNVYSTLLSKGDKNPKRPVIIYFHAGGFYAFSGQSIWMGPQYFMEREIVLVTANYRLASLVTIAGYSAGGVSVTLHMVSPMSRGLFHRAISMSGSVVGDWKIPTHQLHLAKKQARLVGCPETNSTEIINCLKTKSADEMGQTFTGFHEWGIHPLLKWMPVIEPDFGQERFLTEDPNDLFQKGKTAQVPFMAGVNTYEFSGMAYVAGLAEIFADNLGFNIYRAVNIVSSTNNNPVYYYKFAYKGRYSHYYLPNTNNTVTLGAVHHDELIYLFCAPKLFPIFKEPDPEAKIVDRMTSMWANFARTGNPTPEAPELWKPYTTDNKKYLNIDNDLSMEDGLFAKRYELWDKLFPVKVHLHHKHDATHAKFTEELRFKPPEPVDQWKGTLDATKDGPRCPQSLGFPTSISEDCLVLNVFSTLLPKGNAKPKRPVIVFFHPGGFYSGTGGTSNAGPQHFMDKDIVLVASNYRLGSLGFISTGDQEAPGNNGLKDQVMVLKWVKQNIEAFGGDPNLVTIVGYSAGGASITLHMVSPMSQGLFHRAIAMSGSGVGNWPVPKHQLNLAQKQARLVGCPETNSKEIMKCLKTKSAIELGDSTQGFDEFAYDPIMIWLAVIEPDFGQERFLIEDPHESFAKGKYAQVPFMSGITADEFAWLAYDVVGNSTWQEEMNRDFERVFPISFIYERDTERSKQISRALKKSYFDDKNITPALVTPLAQLYSDGIIGFGVHRIVDLVSITSSKPVYYYRFAYKGRYTHFYLPDTNDTVPYGTVHHDDLLYLFRVARFPEIQKSDPENKIIDHLTTLWANFARTGNPTPDNPALWPPRTSNNKVYLNIDTELTLKDDLYGDRYAVWDQQFPMKRKQAEKNYRKH